MLPSSSCRIDAARMYCEPIVCWVQPTPCTKAVVRSRPEFSTNSSAHLGEHVLRHAAHAFDHLRRVGGVVALEDLPHAARVLEGQVELRLAARSVSARAPRPRRRAPRRCPPGRAGRPRRRRRPPRTASWRGHSRVCPRRSPRTGRRRRRPRTPRRRSSARWCRRARTRGSPTRCSSTWLITPPRKAMSLPARSGTNMSASALVRL